MIKNNNNNMTACLKSHTDKHMRLFAQVCNLACIRLIDWLHCAWSTCSDRLKDTYICSTCHEGQLPTISCKVLQRMNKNATAATCLWLVRNPWFCCRRDDLNSKFYRQKTFCRCPCVRPSDTLPICAFVCVYACLPQNVSGKGNQPV